MSAPSPSRSPASRALPAGGKHRSVPPSSSLLWRSVWRSLFAAVRAISVPTRSMPWRRPGRKSWWWTISRRAMPPPWRARLPSCGATSAMPPVWTASSAASASTRHALRRRFPGGREHGQAPQVFQQQRGRHAEPAGGHGPSWRGPHRLLVLGGGLRRTRQRARQRGCPHPAHQSLRAQQADDGSHDALGLGGPRHPLRLPALFQCGRGPGRRQHRRGPQPREPSHPPGPASTAGPAAAYHHLR